LFLFVFADLVSSFFQEMEIKKAAKQGNKQVSEVSPKYTKSCKKQQANKCWSVFSVASCKIKFDYASHKSITLSGFVTHQNFLLHCLENLGCN